VVDTLGLLIAVVVVAANVSDNASGIDCADAKGPKSSRPAKIWCDAGFKVAFAQRCRSHKIKAEAVFRAQCAHLRSAPTPLDRRTHLGVACQSSPLTHRL
jgi:hypothetical protein